MLLSAINVRFTRIYNVGNITQTLTKILILNKNLVIIQTTWTGGIYMLKKYGCKWLPDSIARSKIYVLK